MICLLVCFIPAGCSFLEPKPDPSRFFALASLPRTGQRAQDAAGTNALALGIGPVKLLKPFLPDVFVTNSGGGSASRGIPDVPHDQGLFIIATIEDTDPTALRHTFDGRNLSDLQLTRDDYRKTAKLPMGLYPIRKSEKELSSSGKRQKQDPVHYRKRILATY